MGEILATACGICCLIFLPFTLQAVGLFTPKWASNSTCDSVGLIYSCCSGACANTNGGDELDVRVLGLQATSFAVMFLSAFGLCYETLCGQKDDDDDDVGSCGVIGGCCTIFFPVAGLFSFIGCMLLVGKYTASELGYSFYLCLSAGCYVLLITFVLCWAICKMVKADGDGDSASSHARENAVAVQSGGGRQVVHSFGGGQAMVGQTVIEQRAVVHDPESGGLIMVIRKINLTRVVSSFRNYS